MFRPFMNTAAEFELVAAAHNDVHGHRYPISVEEVKFFESMREKEFFFERYIIQHEDEDIGELSILQRPWSFHPQKYSFELRMFAAQQTADVLKQVWAFIQERLADKDKIAYGATVIEYETIYTNFLLGLGFEQIMRYPASELVVADFDFAKYEPVVAKVKAAGIEIITADEFKARDADWMHKAWELEKAIFQDVPTPEATQDMPFDKFKLMVEEEPRFDTSQMFLAFDGEDLVGLSRALIPAPGTKRFWTGLTGVVRSHRRRGIALALKVVSLRAVLDAGGEVIETNNEENNPMYKINMQLGFKPIEAWVDYELAVKSNE